jgi:hypothetical protein
MPFIVWIVTPVVSFGWPETRAHWLSLQSSLLLDPLS